MLLPTPGTFSAVGSQAYFDRAALLLLGHGDGGSWGVMLDRPLAGTLGQALAGGGASLVGAAAAAAPLYLGGDVHTDAFFWLRRGDEQGGGPGGGEGGGAARSGDGSGGGGDEDAPTSAGGGVGSGGTASGEGASRGGRLGKEVLPGLWVSPVSVGDDGTAGSTTGRVVRGCAGWGDGQLQSEVDRGVWVVASCNGPALWGGEEGGWGEWPGTWRRLMHLLGGKWAAAAAADEEGRGGGRV